MQSKDYTIAASLMRILKRDKMYLKSDSINNMDYMHISSTESSSVILSQTKNM